MPMSEGLKKRLLPRIPEIAESFKTEHLGKVFHIIDSMGVAKAHKMLTNPHPDVSIINFFAVKANPILLFLKFLLGLGSGLDCSSVWELNKAIYLGAAEDKIMFTSNGTREREFGWFVMSGGILNLDDISLVKKVPNPFPRTICFRYNCGSTRSSKDSNSIIGDPQEAKYGVPDDLIVEAYKLAMERGAKDFVLHTMFASNSLRPEVMAGTLEMLLNVAKRLKKELGIKVRKVNIGGGFGINYLPEDKPFDIQAFGLAADAFICDFESEMGYSPQILTESGRYISGPHGVLVMEITGIEEKYFKVARTAGSSLANLARDVIYDGSYHHITVLDKYGVEKEGSREEVSICGQLCENLDHYTKLPGGRLQRELPIIERGDFVVIHDAGAHGWPMGSGYNDHPLPQCLMMDSHSVSRIMREQTYEDAMNRMYDEVQARASMIKI